MGAELSNLIHVAGVEDTSSGKTVRYELNSQRDLSTLVRSYGQHLFKGAVAAPYLQKHDLPSDTLETSDWTVNGNADKVSKASDRQAGGAAVRRVDVCGRSTLFERLRQRYGPWGSIQRWRPLKKTPKIDFFFF